MIVADQMNQFGLAHNHPDGSVLVVVRTSSACDYPADYSLLGSAGRVLLESVVVVQGLSLDMYS